MTYDRHLSVFDVDASLRVATYTAPEPGTAHMIVRDGPNYVVASFSNNHCDNAQSFTPAKYEQAWDLFFHLRSDDRESSHE